MSKTSIHEKTQQDLHKYWNSTTSNTATKEKDHLISSNNELNITNRGIDQPTGITDQTVNLNDKKRKAPVKEKIREETISPPSKRMHETTINKDELHRSSSSSNLQVMTTPNPNPNTNPNPSWMVEMERHLENNLTINLTENLRNIINESMNKAIERVTASVNKIIEANPVIQTHSNAIVELQKESVENQTSVRRINKDQEELKAKLISIENRTLENCLVFRGVPEGEYEKESETSKKIKEALKNLISSNSDKEAEQTVKNFEIQRCKRLGKYFKDQARPISVDFLQKDNTDYIMDNKSQLPEGIYADREYNQETERKRKLLRPILKAAKQHKDFQGRCKMDRDTLVLRGKCYTVNTIDQLPNSLSTVNVTSKSNETTFGYFGELNPLSNFHPSPFRMYDQEYHCSEQYIQEAKAKYFNYAETYNKLHNTKTGLECKIIAKQTKNFNAKKWEQIAKDICKPAIKQKFQMNHNPRCMLLEYTKNKLIIECAKDTLWGTGVPLDNEMCLDSSMWKGYGTKKQA